MDPPSCLDWGRAVGESQHRLQRPGKVVGQRTAVVFLGHRHQTGHAQEEKHEEVEGQGRPQCPGDERGPTAVDGSTGYRSGKGREIERVWRHMGVSGIGDSVFSLAPYSRKFKSHTIQMNG